MLKACPKLIVKPSWILCEICVDFCVWQGLGGNSWFLSSLHYASIAFEQL